MLIYGEDLSAMYRRPGVSSGDLADFVQKYCWSPLYKWNIHRYLVYRQTNKNKSFPLSLISYNVKEENQIVWNIRIAVYFTDIHFYYHIFILFLQWRQHRIAQPASYSPVIRAAWISSSTPTTDLRLTGLPPKQTACKIFVIYCISR